jgi:hypothetical protein
MVNTDRDAPTEMTAAMDTGSDDHRLRAEWAAAEAKIYPLVMVDAHGYQSAVVAVAAVVDLLRLEAHDLDALRSIVRDPIGAIARAGADPATFPGSVTAEIVVAAACATRQREIDAQVLARRRVDALSAARVAGQRWAEVHAASGPLERHGVPELRVDVTTGTGIHTAPAVDPQTADPTLLVMPVHVEPSSGAMSAAAGVEPRTVACDQQAWRAAADGLLEILLDRERGGRFYGHDDPSTPPEG